MCGIFGLVHGQNIPFSKKEFSKSIADLFLAAESRGREAAGLAIETEHNISVYKDSISASKILKCDSYNKFLNKALSNLPPESTIAAIGHSRLVTNGLQGIDANNQPILKHNMVAVHNGIVVNEKAMWEAIDAKPTAQVDTEVLLAYLNHHLSAGSSLEESVSKMFNALYGETTLAILSPHFNKLILATNTGSLYYANCEHNKAFYFASEQHSLPKCLPYFNAECVKQLETGTFAIIDLSTNDIRVHPMSSEQAEKRIYISNSPTKKIIDKWYETESARDNIKRCTRCILPETMPFIAFDEAGVCNFCHNHAPHKIENVDTFNQRIQSYKRNGQYDCIVGFSGGRDSSYGLHLLKQEMGIKPVAFTYDWGMVTDLARRNQSRICGKLGIEHIWLSADIRAKRRNIRQNVSAWLKRPRLGTIPLFMAGDKAFMYHLNKYMEKTGLEMVVVCESPYEKSCFKSGFAGVSPFFDDKSVYKLSMGRKLNLAKYYGTEYLLNPSYINSSLLDTAFAFFSYYLMNQNYLYLFKHLDWSEDEVNKILIDEYDWELADDCSTTWRIGDGTAPFYNHIYYTVAGFTEFDTFRSNQIRDGKITRDEALKLVKEENMPRFESIKEYMGLIHLDFDHAMRVIDRMPKLYAQD